VASGSGGFAAEGLLPALHLVGQGFIHAEADMGNRIIGTVTLVCFIAYLGGCSSARFIPLEE